MNCSPLPSATFCYLFKWCSCPEFLFTTNHGKRLIAQLFTGAHFHKKRIQPIYYPARTPSVLIQSSECVCGRQSVIQHFAASLAAAKWLKPIDYNTNVVQKIVLDVSQTKNIQSILFMNGKGKNKLYRLNEKFLKWIEKIIINAIKKKMKATSKIFGKLEKQKRHWSNTVNGAYVWWTDGWLGCCWFWHAPRVVLALIVCCLLSAHVPLSCHPTTHSRSLLRLWLRLRLRYYHMYM